jgi:hypothetical protein
MRELIQQTLLDIHAGRETWRVLTLFSGVALAVTAIVLFW